MNKDGVIFCVIALLFISFGVWMWNSPGFMPADLSEHYFCKEKGFETNSNYGHYQQYKDKDYGRIECGSCYVEGCDWVKFNVTKDWRGNLHDAYVATGEGEQDG